MFKLVKFKKMKLIENVKICLQYLQVLSPAGV